MKTQNVHHEREWAFSSYMSLSLLQLAMSIEEAPINAPRVVAIAANPWQLAWPFDPSQDGGGGT